MLKNRAGANLTLQCEIEMLGIGRHVLGEYPGDPAMGSNTAKLMFLSPSGGLLNG
jgi:hypothetical protein